MSNEIFEEPSPSHYQGEDLYPLYVKYMEKMRQDILETMPPSPSRDDNLMATQTMPREHFEVRISNLRGRPGDLAAVVRAFKNCDPFSRTVFLR